MHTITPYPLLTESVDTETQPKSAAPARLRDDAARPRADGAPTRSTVDPGMPGRPRRSEDPVTDTTPNPQQGRTHAARLQCLSEAAPLVRRTRARRLPTLLAFTALAACRASAPAPSSPSPPTATASPDAAPTPHDDASTRGDASATASPPGTAGAPAAPNDAATTPRGDDGPGSGDDTKAAPASRVGGLEPFHSVSVYEGWVRVELSETPDIGEALMDRVLDADRSLWRGHALEPAELAAMPPIYIVTTRGVVVASKYSRFGASRDLGTWYVEYRNLRVKEPAIAMAGEPAPQARLRLAPKPKPIRPSHRLAKRMREVALEAANAGAPGAPTVGMVADLATYTLQEIPGSFPQATRIVFVTGDGREDEFNLQIMVLTLDAEGGEHHRIITGPTLTASAVGDLDGDGYDEVLQGYQDYEGVGESIYRFTDSGMETISLWSSEG